MKINKLPKIIVAAAIENSSELAENKEKKYLLIKETLASGNDYWIVPGGTVEFGETLEKALVREIKEETNLDIEIEKFLGFNEAIFPHVGYHTVIFFFLAKPLNNNIILEKNILDSGFFSVEEMKNMDLVESARWVFENHIL